MDSYLSDDSFYDFNIEKNVKTKGQVALKRYKCFHDFEFIRATEFDYLHKSYDRKFEELFYKENAPRDSLNRFLLEQLSLGIVENSKLDQYIPKPENINELSTFRYEIVSNYVLTKPMPLEKYINKSRTIKDMSEYLKLARVYLKKLKFEEHKKRFTEKQLQLLDCHLRGAYRCQAKELNDKFESVYEACLPIFDALVQQKVNQLLNYMFEKVKKLSSKMVKELSQSEIQNDNSKIDNIKIIFNETTVQFTYKDSSFTILKQHFDKLKRLYIKNTIELGYDTGLFDDNIFHSRVYCVISRYETFFRNSEERKEGYGMQSAIPNYTFKMLNEEFGVTQEMFASPLNCFFSTYCSAFPDIDVFFGSCGSFFDYDPIEGSFECNPPFTEEVIERMADRIDYLLGISELPLSFIVFIPEWLDPPTPGLIKMKKSVYNRKEVVIPSLKHSYVNGAQFIERKRPLLFNAIHNTIIFFLQNDAGHLKWSPSNDKVEKLKEIMIIKAGQK